MYRPQLSRGLAVPSRPCHWLRLQITHGACNHQLLAPRRYAYLHACTYIHWRVTSSSSQPSQKQPIAASPLSRPSCHLAASSRKQHIGSVCHKTTRLHGCKWPCVRIIHAHGTPDLTPFHAAKTNPRCFLLAWRRAVRQSHCKTAVLACQLVLFPLIPSITPSSIATAAPRWPIQISQQPLAALHKGMASLHIQYTTGSH